MPASDERGATLLVAFWIPDADHDIDPEQVADEFAYMLNQQRMKAGGIKHFKPVEVSGIPPAQWVTVEALRRLREASGAQ